MSSLRLLYKRLNDIWNESEKEMIKMRNKINYLNKCLKVNETITKHSNNCNENLVAIIEKCHIDYESNNDIKVLIDGIKQENKTINKWKNELQSIKCQNKENYDFNEENFIQIIESWRKCQPIQELTHNKYIQTEPEEYFRESVNDCNEMVFKSDTSLALKAKIYKSGNDLRVENITNSDNYYTSDANISSNINYYIVKREITDSQSHNNSIDDIEEESEDVLFPTEDEDLNDSVCESETEDNNYIEIEKSIKNERQMITEFSKPVKKTSTDKIEEQKRIDELILPFKVNKHYECNEPECGFITGVKKLFHRHYNQHKRDNRVRNEAQKVVDELVLNCKVDKHYECKESECNFTTNYKKVFVRHYRQHQREYKLKTKVKSKPKPKANRETIILKSTPENPCPFVCEWPGCDSRFKYRCQLKSHRMFHVKDETFECVWPGCGFRASNKAYHILHERTHTKEKPLSCDWPGCEFRCNFDWSLIAHKRKHTGEKPFECLWPNCEYKCATPSRLKQHKRTHTGERPYACDVEGCGKRFPVLYSLFLHKLKIHENPRVAKKNRKGRSDKGVKRKWNSKFLNQLSLGSHN